MLKPSELRIGNILNYGAHGFVVVDEVKSAGKIKVVHKERHSIDKGYDKSLLWGEYLDPILLTPEIMEKTDWYDLGMGYFKPFGNGTPRKQLNWNTDNVVRIMDASGYVITLAENIQYLHQLQNLYFALTGEELEVRL